MAQPAGDLRSEPAPATGARPAAEVPRRSSVGLVSLLAAVGGALVCQAAIATGLAPDVPWLRIVAAGFEAAVVGGLADWFAVTALFRHPLGIPIPHTALIRTRRAKLTEGIVSMIEDDWLSPEVIGARLARFAPSAVVADWLRDPEHVERLGAPLRDLLRGVARMLREPEVERFVERTIRGQLAELPIDETAGRWLAGAAADEQAGALFDTLAISLANLADRPRTAQQLHFWLDRSARTLRADGKRLIPLLLRRRIVQRKIVEAVRDYASSELRRAVGDPRHPLRRVVLEGIRGFATRLARGDRDAIAQAERLRHALLEALESGPTVRSALGQIRRTLERDLADPESELAVLVDRKLRAGILELLDEPERRAAFDGWVRRMADELLRRHHHQIGITVRENLEALETDTLVARIEERVGADLQYIRLNGAVVGGLIGLLLALGHHLLR